MNDEDREDFDPAVFDTIHDDGDGDAPFHDLPNIHASEGQTDVANSRRFVKLFGDRVRFCHPWGKWLLNDRTRWKPDDDGGIHRLGKAVADAMWSDAGRLDDNAARKWAARTASEHGIRAMLALAASEVPVLPDELDANPWLLNVANGTIDLRNGEHREHRIEDCITKLCDVNYDAEAQAPIWERFQLEIAGGDKALVTFKQRLSGYCSTGSTREQIMAVLHGTGSNGKSTEIEAFMGTLGSDYACAAPRDLLMARKGESHPTELADLFGKRFVVAQETEAGRRLAESLVKQLTGGDTIKARRMREDFWEFQPTHKVALVTNHKPRVRGTDHAIWRRLRLVPFNVRFEGDRKDKNLPDKLRAERAGILAWVVRGAVDWYREGLTDPEAVKVATAAYRSESDVIGKFLNDCCVLGDLEKFKVKFSNLHESLDRWCKDVGDSTPTKRTVTDALEEQGFKRLVSNGLWFKGLGLKAE